MVNNIAVLFGIPTAYAETLWVQVPQWSDDWEKCAVDVPDAACHWYVARQIILLEKDLTGRMLRGIVQKD